MCQCQPYLCNYCVGTQKRKSSITNAHQSISQVVPRVDAKFQPPPAGAIYIKMPMKHYIIIKIYNMFEMTGPYPNMYKDNRITRE